MPDRVVYSSDPGFCAACAGSPCRCLAKPAPGKLRQPEPVRLSFLRGGKGSGVTRVERLHLGRSAKEEFLRRFKSRLACGGAIKEEALEIQGDHRAFLEAELRKEGYRVVRAGG